MTHAIGYVAKVFPRASETFVINELRALELLGESPVMFSLHHNPAPVSHAILAELRAPVVYVEDVEVDDRKVRRATESLSESLGIAAGERDRYLPRKYVRLAVAMSELARKFGVRHLHAHFASRSGHVAALASVLSGHGYSITAHAKDIYHRDVDRELLAWKIRNARFVVTVTGFNLDYLSRLLAEFGTPAAGVIRLYNGVDLDRFASRRGAVATPARIVSIGRLVEKKGFGVLIDACARLKVRGVPFHCEIIGGGELEAALRRRIEGSGLGGEITLAGSLSTEDVAQHLRDATVVALPCIVAADGNVDALPTALLEGMAASLPLVSTRLSGIPEIVVDGENGLLVEPDDAGGLADALEKILTDPARATAMGEAGRRRAESLFDLHKNVATLREMLRTAYTAAEGPA